MDFGLLEGTNIKKARGDIPIKLTIMYSIINSTFPKFVNCNCTITHA